MTPQPVYVVMYYNWDHAEAVAVCKTKRVADRIAKKSDGCVERFYLLTHEDQKPRKQEEK